MGVAGDVALHAGVVGLAGALASAAAAGALLGSSRLETVASKALVGAAPVFGIWLALRTSPWLLPLDVLAVAGLLCLGASLARGRRWSELPPVQLLRSGVHAAEHLVGGPALLLDRAGSTRPRDAGGWRRHLPIVRGLLLAAPVVLAFGALLASADVVFASLVDVHLDGPGLILHAFGFAVVSWGALGLLRLASAVPAPEADAVPTVLGRVEAAVVLAAVVALFGTFVATQVVAATGGADHVLDTAGLTRAEYARSGFFQLLWVAGLTVAGVLLVAQLADFRVRALRILTWAVVGLSVGIVAVAVVRLDLYRDAYGWTMLRLFCTAFAGWIAVVLVLLGVAVAGPARVRDVGWFLPASAVAGLALLLVLNVVNPEAMVARHNLTREAVVAVDRDYLVHLGDDAVPTIVALLPTLPADEQRALRAALGCPPDDDDGWASWNRSTEQAEDARDELCRV